MTDTLIAGADGLYHSGDYDDRLVLGLKGTMSEAELHVLRYRLDAGLRHKAARGELRQLLPVGLDYDKDGRVVLSPDEAVRTAIAAVFDRFDELGSARQAMLPLRADGLRLPCRCGSSAGPRRPSRRSTLADEPGPRRGVRVRTNEGEPASGRGRLDRRPRARITARGVGGDHPGSSSRLCVLADLFGQPGPAACQCTPAARAGRRGGARGPRPAAGAGGVRQVWARMLVGCSGPDGRVPRYLYARGLRL
jgi:hypothetical protein